MDEQCITAALQGLRISDCENWGARRLLGADVPAETGGGRERERERERERAIERERQREREGEREGESSARAITMSCACVCTHLCVRVRVPPHDSNVHAHGILQDMAAATGGIYVGDGGALGGGGGTEGGGGGPKVNFTVQVPFDIGMFPGGLGLGLRVRV